ncbi:Ig-like domain-containing protein [Nocardioides zhouii]|uniref:Ig-like domain repeat protein n=1 Tax=Nocardioides zhouii TaxID=1168729 RepID=A0A4Q2T708_9ACTN|nr:Ig-like domain-containing protein [Nocardioides zhouii]RYC14666.1 Ig-like domain repeat protein [Nocardioides zhouii]
MMTFSVRTRSRRAAAAVASGSLAVVALAALPPAAEAVSPSIDYTCTADGLGTFTLPVVLDTNAPPRMITGQSTQLIVTAKATLPGETAKAIAAKPATQVEATLTSSVTFGTAAANPVLNVPRTALNDQTVPTAVLLNGASAPFTYTAPPTPSTLEVSAGRITGSLRFFNNNVAAGDAAISCEAPNGKPPVIDTIAVAASTTTTLTLARATATYGQDVNASAKVVASSGTPAGEVVFFVDGIVTRAKVDKDGIASLVLPDAAVGAHSIVATFAPTDLAAFVGSSSAAQAWTVAKAETKVRIPVTGRTTNSVTRVGVKAAGVYGTVPTGKVQLKVKRLGKPGKWLKSRTLSDAGTAQIRLGVLAQGRYRVVVTYRGDVNHLAERKTKTFKVARR